MDLTEKILFKYTYNVQTFFKNIDKILENHEEKEKKKEIGKIINSLQTPFNIVLSQIKVN